MGRVDKGSHRTLSIEREFAAFEMQFWYVLQLHQ